MVITIPKDIYPKIVVLKAAYHFTDVAYIFIQQSATEYIVNITAKTAENKIVEEEFKNELLSQSVRHELYKQTKNIRQLITMRALASTIVGEQIDVLEPTQAFSEDEILKDWFEDEDKKI